MSIPGPSSGVAAVRARTGSAWWSARAGLAWRRARRFVMRWSIGTGAITIAALVAPILSSDPAAPNRARLERLAADTLRSAQRLRTAEAAVATAESLLVSARAARLRVVPPRPASPTVTTPMSPVVEDLARRLDEARRLRTTEALLQLAAHPSVSGGPRMRALADSLRTLDSVRTVDPTLPEAEALVPTLSRIGVSIIAVGANRLRLIQAAADSLAAPIVPAAPVESAVAPAPPPDTTLLVSALTTAHAELNIASRAHDSAQALIRSTETARAPAARSLLSRVAPALALLVVLVIGAALRFGAALRSELNAPTLADAQEAERMTGLRTLTTVRDALLDGPARFKPSGVDPFRMLYLSLTATGTRARTALVVGADLEIAAATGARLAIAAAADHRNTLIVDLDASRIALSRTFRERAEPGLHDVLARAFTWREVARPVGSSDGLPITLLPAGTERDEPQRGREFDELMTDFERFRSAFELTLAVAPLSAIDLATALVSGSPVLLTAVAGETSIDDLVALVAGQRAAGRKIAGLVVWDAPRPTLPTRAELVAQLSKRKGRTPGGSFEAVRRAIDPKNHGNTRP